MIDDLDRSLTRLLESELGNPLPFDLSFAVPDQAFTPLALTRSTLCCYLYDIREDRDLRDPVHQVRIHPGGLVASTPPAARIRISYCITAWSPVQATPGIAPHLDEHALLASVLRALLRHPEFPAAALTGVLTAQPLPMPTTVGHPDSARNSGDFWNAIGGQLRPSLEYAVTLSLAYDAEQAGPAVTTVSTAVGTGAARLLIGGIVLGNPAPPQPVPAAWVRIDQTGEVAVADEEGRFRLLHVPAGAVTVRMRATGFHEAVLAWTIPAPPGSTFDVVLDPL